MTQLEKDRIYKLWCMGYSIEELAAVNEVSKPTIYKAIGYRPKMEFEGTWEKGVSPPPKVIEKKEECKPGYRYEKPKAKRKKMVKGAFANHLKTLKEEGKDYVEEQRKQTIEMYARVIV